MLCHHGDITKVSFTGGIQTGAKVYFLKTDDEVEPSEKLS